MFRTPDLYRSLSPCSRVRSAIDRNGATRSRMSALCRFLLHGRAASIMPQPTVIRNSCGFISVFAARRVDQFWFGSSACRGRGSRLFWFGAWPERLAIRAASLLYDGLKQSSPRCLHVQMSADGNNSRQPSVFALCTLCVRSTLDTGCAHRRRLRTSRAPRSGGGVSPLTAQKPIAQVSCRRGALGRRRRRRGRQLQGLR